jgi:hypothetical protein
MVHKIQSAANAAMIPNYSLRSFFFLKVHGNWARHFERANIFEFRSMISFLESRFSWFFGKCEFSKGNSSGYDIQITSVLKASFISFKYERICPQKGLIVEGF